MKTDFFIFTDVFEKATHSKDLFQIQGRTCLGQYPLIKTLFLSVITTILSSL